MQPFFFATISTVMPFPSAILDPPHAAEIGNFVCVIYETQY